MDILEQFEVVQSFNKKLEQVFDFSALCKRKLVQLLWDTEELSLYLKGARHFEQYSHYDIELEGLKFVLTCEYKDYDSILREQIQLNASWLNFEGTKLPLQTQEEIWATIKEEFTTVVSEMDIDVVTQSHILKVVDSVTLAELLDVTVFSDLTKEGYSVFVQLYRTYYTNRLEIEDVLELGEMFFITSQTIRKNITKGVYTEELQKQFNKEHDEISKEQYI